MKKNIKKLLLLGIILLVISNTIILIFGRTYTAVFNNKSDYKLDIENDTGKVAIIKEKKNKDYYYITLKGLKTGRAYLKYSNGEIGVTKSLYIHKSMVISEENYFGKTTASEVIPISLSIFIIYLLIILFQRYNQSKKENLYQYRNIAYLGIIIYLLFFVLSNLISLLHYQGLFNTINNVLSSISFVSFILFPIMVITFVMVTISNIMLIRKEGISFRNIMGLLLGIFLCITPWIPDFVYGILMKSQTIDIYNLNGQGPYIYNFIETLVYLSVTYLECLLLATIIIAIKSIKKTPEYNKDYMIILGCQIKKDGSLTPLLKGRVDRAIEFRNNQLANTGKDLIFIPSGGQGANEVISEAKAMQNYLLEQGIKKDHIVLEDKAENTYENIRNSYQLIKNKKAKVAFSTTNYHLLRAGLLATSQGIITEGIGSKTKAYFWINAFIREFIGTLYAEKKKHIIVIIITLIIIILMIAITYIANNII